MGLVDAEAGGSAVMRRILQGEDDIHGSEIEGYYATQVGGDDEDESVVYS
jgi:hypothetical protein